MSSWVKVSRKLLTSAIASKPEYLAVWMHLILTASYKPGEVLVGHQVIKLNAGQLVFGRIKFAAQIGVSEHTLRMALKSLEKLQQITIKSESKFSVISITNWDKYQTDSPASHQQATSKPPASHHNKEVQEIQEGKEVKPLRSAKAVAGEDFEKFWKLYPKKVSKKDATKAWLKIKPEKYPAVMNGLARYRVSEQWAKDSGQFVPNAATWLNAERWEDEVTPYVKRTEASRTLSAVDRVKAGAAERERNRQGAQPEYFDAGDCIEGEFSAGPQIDGPPLDSYGGDLWPQVDEPVR